MYTGLSHFKKALLESDRPAVLVSATWIPEAISTGNFEAVY